MRPFLLASAVLLLPVVVAQPPQAAPTPPATVTRPDVRTDRPAAPAGLLQWDIGQPSDEEQKLLEEVNRARANPVAEAALLQALDDPFVKQAYDYFLVDFTKFKTDMSAFPALPPLAPNAQLIGAARGHSQWMLANAEQNHFEGALAPSDRVTASGYIWTIVGESIYAYAYNPVHAHASFEVDWGLLDILGHPISPGMQNPPGHRLNNHNAAFREAGIGMVRGTNSSVVGGTVGPQLYTIEFAAHTGPYPYVTGVAYFDLDGAGSYDVGEGIPGIRVDVADSGYFAVSTASGGFALPTSEGTHKVTFSAPGMTSATASVTITSGANAKVDLRLPYVPPALTGPAAPVVGVANAYQPAAVPAATGYQWVASRRSPATTTLGAENGSEGVSIEISPGYACIQNAHHASGANSYRLTNPDGEDQVLRLTNHYAAGALPVLHFSYLFGYATPDQRLSAEISLDEGQTWKPVWSAAGHSSPDSLFTSPGVSLAEYAQREFQIRFRFAVAPGGSFYNTTNLGEGVYLDAIGFDDAYTLSDVASGKVAANATVPFVPPTTGAFLLSVAPSVGSRVLPSGPKLLVNAVVAPAVVKLASPVLGAGGKVRVDFGVAGGAPVGFALERVTSLGAAWATDLSAVLSNVSPGNYTFRADPPAGGTAYYRVKVL